MRMVLASVVLLCPGNLMMSVFLYTLLFVEVRSATKCA